MHREHEHDSETEDLLKAILRTEREQLEVLEEIERNTHPHHYTLIEVIQMANPIASGSTGQLGWQLQDNGVNDTTGFALTLTYHSDVAGITFTPATADQSGGTIPLADQTVVNVPATNTATTTVITASSPAPDGTTASGSITLTLTPGVAQKFTLVGTQLLP